MMDKLKNWLDPYTIAPSILIALFVIIGASFDIENSFDFIFQDGWSIFLCTLCFLLSFALMMVALTALFSWFDDSTRNQEERGFFEIVKKRLPFFLMIILICWIPWIIIHYPGTMRDDSIRQLFQIYSIEPYSNANPLIDTFIFGLFWQLGDLFQNRALGLFLYGLAQAFFTAVSFSLLLCYLEKIGVKKAYTYICLGLFSLFAIFPLAAMSMSKDSLNGWLFVLFFIGFVELCRSKGAILKRPSFLIIFPILTIFLIATKKTMLYVVIIAFLFFVLFNSKTRVKATALFLAVLLVSVAFSDTFMPSVMKNEAPENSQPSSNNGASFLILPLQQTGRLLAEGVELDANDYDALSRYIDCELTGEIYNPIRADEVVWASNGDATSEDRNAYLSTWFRLGFQHPDIYLSALTNQLYGWFCHTYKIKFGYDLSLDVFDEVHMSLWGVRFEEGPSGAYEFLKPLDTDLDIFDGPQAVLDFIAGTEYSVPLLASFGLWCTWIPLIGFFYALKRKNRQALLAFSVPAAVLLSLFIGPGVLYWYAIPMFYTAPLILVLGFIRQRQKSTKTASTGEMKDTKQYSSKAALRQE